MGVEREEGRIRKRPAQCEPEGSRKDRRGLQEGGGPAQHQGISPGIVERSAGLAGGKNGSL